MPSLKDLRDRKKSVESTRKITSAMKMVAAAKLRRAQEQAQSARVYAQSLAEMLQQLTSNPAALDESHPLIVGTGHHRTHLFVIMTSDRGLCGGFNAVLIRELKAQILALEAKNQAALIYAIGRKGRDPLKVLFGERVVASRIEVAKPRLTYETAQVIAQDILNFFEQSKFDVCHLIYSHSQSAMVQFATTRQLIPLAPSHNSKHESVRVSAEHAHGHYTYEPNATQILEGLLLKNVTVQVFRALLESAASEHGARMTAMDNATRNAGDMIRKLDLTYNRARQAYITKELIEIISGAEAL